MIFQQALSDICINKAVAIGKCNLKKLYEWQRGIKCLEIDAQTKNWNTGANFTLSNNFAVVMGDERFTGCLEKKHFMHLICLYIKGIVRILNRLWSRKMRRLMQLYD